MLPANNVISFLLGFTAFPYLCITRWIDRGCNGGSEQWFDCSSEDLDISVTRVIEVKFLTNISRCSHSYRRKYLINIIEVVNFNMTAVS